MAKWLVLMLALGFWHTDNWSAVITTIEPSVVFVQIGNDGSCTGFVINQAKHYVLTAGHCQPQNEGVPLWVDRVRGRIVSLDPQKDLMVVEAPDMDPTRPALHLAARDPARGSDVLSLGYGYSFDTPMARQAHVSRTDRNIPEDGIGGPLVEIDAAYVPGQSGGPVVDKTGAVVAIVQRGTNSVGFGVGATIIRERMGRFFEATVKASR